MRTEYDLDRNYGRVVLFRVLLLFDADDEGTIHNRLRDDPWTPMGVLTTVSIERWNVLLGDPLSGR